MVSEAVRQKFFIVPLGLGLVVLTCTTAFGQESQPVEKSDIPLVTQSRLLTGSVEEEDKAETRIHRGELDRSNTPDVKPARVGMVTLSFDPGAKMAPEATKAKYDLDADARSQFLTLAWERWHKLVARTMYERCHTTGANGACIFVLTITRDTDVTIKILKSVGDPRITENVIAAAMSLNGNPLFCFPQGSRRQIMAVSHEFDSGYFADSGGYEWNKKDFERIRQDH